MSFVKDCETFIKRVNEGLEDALDPMFINLLREKAQEVFAPIYAVKGAASPKKAGRPAKEKKASTPESKAKKINGYTVFMQEYSEKHGKIADLFKVAGAAWKALSEEEQKPYKERAETMKHEALEAASNNPTPTENPAPEKKKRGTNGYQVYLKEIINDTINRKQAGEMWKALSEEEKQTWKDKATAINA